MYLQSAIINIIKAIIAIAVFTVIAVIWSLKIAFLFLVFVVAMIKFGPAILRRMKKAGHKVSARYVAEYEALHNNK